MVSRDKTLILRKSDSHLEGHRSCLVRGLETVSSSWWIKPHFLQECLEQSYFQSFTSLHCKLHTCICTVLIILHLKMGLKIVNLLVNKAILKS